MRVGLGTGSTTAHALRALGERLRRGELKRVAGVPTSPAAERLARAEGIPLATLDEAGGLDLALDGADEVSPALNLIKGRGAAHAREKVVAAEAERFAVLADPSKEVERLGQQVPVPVEVMPMAAAGPATRFLKEAGATAVELRPGVAKDGPVVTELEPLERFWRAEEKHQSYFDKNPNDAYCQMHAQPKIEKVREKFREKVTQS
ncbi:MAG: ribose 5-phosphate isomerase A [Bacteroidetes bacterium QS_9_68_14]|nr:MAG: ribose 5-phosphate isomerase A [Bacteroidetes bacterium QS_9_68_14]